MSLYDAVQKALKCGDCGHLGPGEAMTVACGNSGLAILCPRCRDRVNQPTPTPQKDA